ncbi:dTMP kinase [archaeon]|nr:dTMP kinase [archaeon]
MLVQNVLITFEGIDGAGKTTQSRLLKKWLESKGYQVLLTSEPTNNQVGRVLKKRMRMKTHNWVEAVLFAADRALHCEKVIIPNLKKIVICDRYIHSTLAYQTSMGLDKKWVKCLNKNAPEPDITIYLDVKPRTAMKRVRKRLKRTIKYEKLKLLKKVREEYLKMKGNKFKVINGEKSIEKVHEEIKRVINDIM